MSEANVEVVRRAMAAYSGTAEVPEDLFDPEIEVRKSPELPGDFAGRGYGNLHRTGETLRETFGEWSIEVERSFDLGDRVLVFLRFRGEGQSSGVPIDGQMSVLLTLRDGRINEWCLFGDRRDALEAAGLSE